MLEKIKTFLIAALLMALIAAPYALAYVFNL